MKRRKKKVWLIILIVVLALILALVIGGYSVIKTYLGQIGRTYNDPIETVAPEDEFFDVDETPVVPETPEPAETNSGGEETPSDPPAEPTEPNSGREEIPSDPPAEPTEPNSGGEETPSDQPAEPTESNRGGEEIPSNPLPEPSESTGEESIESVIDPADVEWPFIKKIEDDHLINILLVGQDKYPGTESARRQRSDTMILCSINPKTGEVALISFLRDLYVQIPGDYSDNRLNVPYVFGGFELLDKTLEKNFGVSIDANFEVDLASFEAIIDMIGGVDVELTAKEAEYFQYSWDSSIKEGVNHFNGVYARYFAQLRKIDSDFGRTGRQREVLLAVYDKIKTLSVSELLTLMYNALPYVTTDLTDRQILSLAYRLLPLVSSMEIDTYSVPSKGTYTGASVRGMSVLMPDLEKIRDLLENEYLPLK